MIQVVRRFLLWHPESECIYEETDPIEIEKDLSTGQVFDVTGDPYYEKMYQEKVNGNDKS